MLKVGLLEEILDMKEKLLREFILKEAQLQQIQLHYDAGDLRRMSRQELMDVIGDEIYPHLRSRIHSECQLKNGHPMLPYSYGENPEDDVEYAMQRIANS